MKVNSEHLYNKLLELLLVEAEGDKSMKSYLTQGGFDSDIEEFVDCFISAANDHDEDSDDDKDPEDSEDEDDDMDTVYPEFK